MTTLYIVGNGFDLYHRLPTSFAQFRHYVRATDGDLARAIDDYLPVDRQWSDLEVALAGLDPDDVVDTLGMFLPSYGDDEWSDAGHHDFSYEVQRLTSALSDGLVERFGEWVRQVPRLTAAQAMAGGNYLPVDPAAWFITFNYTPTLADVYAVPASQTWHVHGRSLDPTSRLVLGHGWIPELTPAAPTWSSPAPDGEDDGEGDIRIAHGRQYVEDYFRATYKETGRIIEDGRAFLCSLHEVTQIYVLGHSLADVDLPYFVAIADHVHPHAHVWFSWYEPDDQAHHAAALEAAGFEPSTFTCGTLNELVKPAS